VIFVGVKGNTGENKFPKMMKTIAMKEVAGEYVQESATSAAVSHKVRMKSQTAKNASNTFAVVEGEVKLIQTHKKKMVKAVENQLRARVNKNKVSKKTLLTKALSNKDSKLRIMILRCQVNQFLCNPEIQH